MSKKKIPLEAACRYIISNHYEESILISIPDGNVYPLISDDRAAAGMILTACARGYEAGIRDIIEYRAFTEDDRDALSMLLPDNMMSRLEGGGQIRIRCRLRNNNGCAHWKCIECAIFDESGYILMLVTDIQEEEDTKQLLQEAAEEAETASRAKSAFLANMSHEIRTPMNAIVGISEILLRKELPQDVLESLSTIQNSGSSLLGIINDILDFSKIETGKFEITEVEYMLPSLLMDISNVISVRIGSNPVYFMMEIDPSLPNHFIGDDIRIKQILMNLLGNAVKFTHEGFITLRVSGREIVPDECELKFDVIDSGIGIREEDLGKLFATFSQVDTRKNRGTTGSGLGLVISRNLARLMGGDLTVSSVYGQGSTFTVTIRQQVPRYMPIGEVQNRENIRLLICEPNEILVSSLSRVAESLGLKYKICREIDRIREFEDMTHVLIRRRNFAAVREKLNFIYKREDILLILDSDELPDSSFMEYKQLQLPLITLQLINALNGDEIVSSMKKQSFDRSQIIPLTYAHVLVVDDNSTNLQVAQGLMSPYQMHVDTTTSGFDAIEMVKHNHYDAIFMDHMMPEMDGIEASGCIRDLDGDYYKNVPIIALTANAMSDARELFLEAGMTDFVAKPIEMRELHRVIKKYIQSVAPEGYLEKAVKQAAKAESGDKAPETPQQPAAGSAAAPHTVSAADSGMLMELIKQNNALLGQNTILLKALLGDDTVMPQLPHAPAEIPAAAPAPVPEAAAADPAAGESAEAFNELPDLIRGVDMHRSLETYGGNVQIYHNILKTYYSDLCEKEQELPVLFDKGDVENFTIQVHALKSASRSVGAADLGEEAWQLEQAGKAGDMDTIREKFPQLMEDLHMMRENVEHYVTKYLEVGTASETEFAEEFDADLIAQLREACDSMDYLHAEEILHQLREKTYPEALDSTLCELIRYCESFDYDQLDRLVFTI